MRGQSSIEYILSLTVLMLGVAAFLAAPQMLSGVRFIYRVIVQRVGMDAMP